LPRQLLLDTLGRQRILFPERLLPPQDFCSWGSQDICFCWGGSSRYLSQHEVQTRGA